MTVEWEGFSRSQADWDVQCWRYFGLPFGGTNVGVQLIAYLRSFDLSHSLFVGVLVFGAQWDPRCRGWSVRTLSESRCSVHVCPRGSPVILGVIVGEHPRVTASEYPRRFVVLAILTVVGSV